MTFALVLIAALAGCGGDEVPQNTMLWHVEGWQTPPANTRQDVRTSRGTLLGFRANGEYVEVHCTLIEQPDQTVFIQSGRPCVAAVGRWEQSGSTVSVTREGASAAALCTQPRVDFRVSGNTVVGNLTGSGERTYAPVTRLVAPEFETHVDQAKSGTKCQTGE